MEKLRKTQKNKKTYKSAHTTLVVKACLLGGISYTKCSMAFINIAVAVSALAGGQKRFRTETRIRRGSELKRVLIWNFGSFWQASGNGGSGEK